MGGGWRTPCGCLANSAALRNPPPQPPPPLENPRALLGNWERNALPVQSARFTAQGPSSGCPSQLPELPAGPLLSDGKAAAGKVLLQALAV